MRRISGHFPISFMHLSAFATVVSRHSSRWPNGRRRPAKFGVVRDGTRPLPTGSFGAASTDTFVNITLQRREIILMGSFDCEAPTALSKSGPPPCHGPSPQS